MKKYNIDNLYVVKVGSENNVRYIICLHNRLFNTYTDVFTEERIIPTSQPLLLGGYYTISELYDRRKNGKINLTKSELLEKYLEINKMRVEDKEPIKKEQPKQREIIKKEKKKLSEEEQTKILEQATSNFFPKKGVWWSNCFDKSEQLSMGYLPCNLRNNKWLASMLRKTQDLEYIDYYDVLHFVKNSELFAEARHNYELEIVRWQIEWMVNGGDGWVCDEEMGGDFTLMSSLCDIGFRKGVVDTLESIGMDRDIIDEGIEKYSDMWRDTFIGRAFYNEYKCVFFLADPSVPIPPIDKEHKEAWIKYRKYQYFMKHRVSVEKYGNPDTLEQLSQTEAYELKTYLDEKDKERKEQIEQYKKQALGKGRTLSLW